MSESAFTHLDEFYGIPITSHQQQLTLSTNVKTDGKKSPTIFYLCWDLNMRPHDYQPTSLTIRPLVGCPLRYFNEKSKHYFWFMSPENIKTLLWYYFTHVSVLSSSSSISTIYWSTHLYYSLFGSRSTTIRWIKRITTTTTTQSQTIDRRTKSSNHLHCTFHNMYIKLSNMMSTNHNSIKIRNQT